jgi:hypothetical protein
VIVFALTMISNRVEDGRDVDLASLFSTIAAHVEQMARDPQYQRSWLNA